MDMDSLFREIRDILSLSEETEESLHPHARAYVTDTRAMLYTPADIFEHPKSYSFVVDMPGVDPEDIKVRVEDGILHVAGRRKKKSGKDEQGGEEETKVVRVLRQERKRRARFVRKFALPKDVDDEAMEASYKHGVLTVTVKKKAEEEEPPKSKAITVQVS